VVREEWEKRRRSTDLEGLMDKMEGLGSEVLVPLLAKRRLIGFISLGKKSGKGIYSGEDIDLLETLANQTAIAIENAKLYEDLKKQKAVMRRADRLASLGTLTAGLAHEIRNPLVAIKTLTQLLPERLDDEEFRKDFLKIASGEVDRISSLVNELLEFARPTSPQLQLQNIQDTMDGMILLISTETKKKSVEIVTHYEESLPLVAADREQVKQVFLNVLLNAIEATSDGGQVSVEIRTFAKKSGEEFLQVEIRDTGRGIPEEHLENVFTPFFTTKDKGSGLGLSISHQIIQEHGGTISVESRIGEGSSFFINFPVSGEASGDLATDGVEKEAAHSIR
jgi:signal transduction histidine kinase